MTVFKWTELAKGWREIRVPCPHCGALKFTSANDNAYFWGEESRRGWHQAICENVKCGKSFHLKKTRDGVEVRF